MIRSCEREAISSLKCHFIKVYARKNKPIFVWLTVENEPDAANGNLLYRLVLLPQRNVAAFDGTLVFPLHVVEGGPVLRVGRTRAKPGNLNRTLRPFRSVPDRAPQAPSFSTA